ncbi:PREDICTED: CRM-domain containing factor CFM3, chloroplastic/mitochondrial isoform X2 [Tarenaya hassleriana]|uniref:CRM-domain containing factor CFM3, chloroplastic/mitochondrial isoform X2 n=1 Tax=Tarenaya hassleriana TaxID=28532 RepID=UPI00053C9C27|nr:PREDICTED: CRM-domain containing factor CFM3, chloroplastic/mitochondrial isoform X2 [Tarenaya hassleriana]
MALCQFPVNSHTLFSLSSFSLQPNRLQPHDSHVKSSFWFPRLRYFSFNHAFRFDNREFGAIEAAIDIDTHRRTKKKRKPRPGFFEEIRDKWSSRISPRTEKLPWQEREDRIQHQPQRYHEEEEEGSSSGFSLSRKETESSRRYLASDPLSFPRPSGFMSAPWVNGSKPGKFESSSSSGSEANANGFKKVFDSDDRAVDDILEELSESDDDGFESSRARGSSGSDSLGKKGLVSGKEKGIWRRNNTKLAERMVPDYQLQRLRNVALRMPERIKVGSAGVTQALVEVIHEKWKVDEVVKLKFREPLSLNMKRTHETLEKKTGGLVIWRSGSSVVLYRGMNYKLPCVQSFIKQNFPDRRISQHLEGRGNAEASDSVQTTELYIAETENHPKDIPKEQLSELCELNHLLDELGPRFRDWTGRDPLPVDADLLPPIVPGYKAPFRLLLRGVKPCLSDKEMTEFRRLARTMPPHFALGRNRELQGLAKAIAKLWESSAIAKIAIKRGVENTRNERMAEELKRLTGGILLSRNKEFIVVYRGNDFLPPAVAEALTERQNELTEVLQTEEDRARELAGIRVTSSQAKSSKIPKMIAGTLAETIAATSRWAPEPSSVDIDKLKRESAAIKRASIIRDLELRLLYAKRKFRKAERALAKVQRDLEPSELPSDSEIITDEERLLFRKMGLSMKPYLLVGRREVYDGTIENMHLHWKHRELVKIIVRGRTLPQVKHIAISLEAESGGVLVSVDNTTKGYAIILYRGKNYRMPYKLRPSNLLSRRQALARSVELQRREALKHHIADLEERIELLKNSKDLEPETGRKSDEEQENLYLRLDDSDLSSEDTDEDERESETGRR